MGENSARVLRSTPRARHIYEAQSARVSRKPVRWRDTEREVVRSDADASRCSRRTVHFPVAFCKAIPHGLSLAQCRAGTGGCEGGAETVDEGEDDPSPQSTG